MSDPSRTVVPSKAEQRSYTVLWALLGGGLVVAMHTARARLGPHWGGAVFMGALATVLTCFAARRLQGASWAEAAAGGVILAMVAGFWYFFIGI